MRLDVFRWQIQAVFLPGVENIVSSDSKKNVFGNEILMVGAPWNMSFFHIELIYLYDNDIDMNKVWPH